MGRPRVYIAGPISRGNLTHNIQQARDAAKALIARGFAPMVPQLTCFMASDTPAVSAGIDHATWLDVDLPWVDVADAVLRLPGESTGADIEVARARERGIPVYSSVDDLLEQISCPAPAAERGDPRFHALLSEIADLHAKKGADYGRGVDVFANCRASESWGIPAWIGTMVRACDKVKRLQTLADKGSLANEAAEDSFKDLAAYALIALILFRENAGIPCNLIRKG